ncbi:hypothetical protein RRG08_033317 [Elysia crispata]|uniref:Nose resistant-to-fluoxetine protein N-terminal domain-containing protein n=1 Tax=Elysia crispata TaxID=231223 RepID=A0AAE0XMT4_9GAST|nr:hypothetical protein RRG08_033317 [Elysia crispata]
MTKTDFRQPKHKAQLLEANVSRVFPNDNIETHEKSSDSRAMNQKDSSIFLKIDSPERIHTSDVLEPNSPLVNEDKLNSTFFHQSRKTKRNVFSRGLEGYLSDIQQNFEAAGKQAVLSAAAAALSSAFHLPDNSLAAGKTNIIGKIGANINAGMKAEAAILDAALPMVKELLHIPDGQPRRSPLSLANVLDQSQCALDFERSLAALLAKKRWAGKLFDSWGKLPPGILKVYANFRGEYKECREIRAPAISANMNQLGKLSPNLNLASLENLAEEQNDADTDGSVAKSELVQFQNGLHRFPEFRGKFCHVGVTLKGIHIAGGKAFVSSPPVVVGLTMDWCVPSSCSESQITDLWNHTFTQLTKDKAFGMPVEPIPASCQEDLPRIEGKTIGILIFITLCLLGQGACTYYDVYYIQKPKWRLERLKSKFISKRNDLLTHTGTVQTRGQSEQREPLIARENHGPYPDDGNEALTSDDMAFYDPELRTSQQVIQVFSLYTNGQRLLNTKLAPHTLTCVHGIRAISMAWIVMGHSVLYSMPVAENTVDFYLRERKVIYSMIITNGPFSVDTFFILSGIMVGYTFLEIYEANSRFKWPVFVLYRFFRLSPSMVVVGALYICLWPVLGSGPAYPAKCPDEEVCTKYWYYSFFFINTVVETGRKCMGWTWYLSVDYQLYLLSPFLMVPIVRGWKKTGVTLAVLMSLGFIVAAGVISHKYKMAETLIQTATKDGGLVNVYEVLNKLYYVPWCRVAPYIMGLMLGYSFKVTERKIRVPKGVVIVGWTLSTATALFMVFGMYDSYSHRHLTTVLGAAIYNALKDAGFSMAVAWVIFACVTGHGGVVNSILSWKAFILVSRVTYCMYLVHIPILFYFAFTNEGTVWWTESYLVINWLGLLSVSTVVATIISLTTEAPSLRAQKLILTKLGFPVSG